MPSPSHEDSQINLENKTAIDLSKKSDTSNLLHRISAAKSKRHFESITFPESSKKHSDSEIAAVTEHIQSMNIAKSNFQSSIFKTGVPKAPPPSPRKINVTKLTNMAKRCISKVAIERRPNSIIPYLRFHEVLVEIKPNQPCSVDEGFSSTSKK